MIEIKAFGGLGNQMFQYAMVLYMQLSNENVFLNISDFNVHKHHQGFELEKIFNITGPYHKSPSELCSNSNSLIVRSLQKLFKCNFVKNSEYYENKELSFIQEQRLYSDCYLVGFWQDIRYISPVESQLKQVFQFIVLDKLNCAFYESIKDFETVSVHVRRGDYISNAGLGGICDLNYYNQAIDQIRKVICNPKFVFFSDDIDWCKKQFSDLDAVFVDWNTGENSFRDMQLMAMCKHNIIANSTFSWWGAFLNNHADKIVIMPKKWNEKYNLNRLVYSGWITL